MDWKRRMSVEVKDSDLKGISVGDTITITCKGIVKELHLGDPPKEEDKKKRKEKGCCGCGIPYHEPSRVAIEMSSQKVEAGKNVFDTLVASDEKDED